MNNFRSRLKPLLQMHLIELPVIFPQQNHGHFTDMLELNPVRQRIADLKGRLDALRGYL